MEIFFAVEYLNICVYFKAQTTFYLRLKTPEIRKYLVVFCVV